MRGALVGSLWFVAACGAIAGLDGPYDDTSVPPVPPATTSGADAAVDASTDGDRDAIADASAPDTRAPPCDENGLVARFPFDEGSGTTAHDCTSGAHLGNVIGADWVPGRIGTHALSFKDSTVDLGNLPYLQLTGAMTIAAWINPTVADQNGRIFSKSTQSDRGWELNMEIGGTIEFKIGTDVASYEQASAPITGGAWVHVAGVYVPGTALRLYIAGALANENTTNIPAVQRDAPFDVLIGAASDGSGYHFDGLIDDVRIYDRALSAAEVKALAAAQ